MSRQELPGLQMRRDRALQRMDAGHRALLQSLEGLDPEEAFLGSRWSVWEVMKHLDSAEFVDSLERVMASDAEMLPGFDSRDSHLKRDLDHQEAVFQRLRRLFAGLSGEQLARPVTPPNPQNNFPGLSMLELMERVVGHEATHAQQIEATRKYVAAFSAKERAVTFAGLGPGDPSLVHPRVRELLSYADYTAGTAEALDVVRPWIRGLELALGDDNLEEVLSRLGREARSGLWPVVVCLGDPTESHPGLIELARQYCDHVAVLPGLGVYQQALAACQLSPLDSLAFSFNETAKGSRALDELAAALSDDTRHVVVLGDEGVGDWPLLARQLVERGAPAVRRVVVLSGLATGGVHRREYGLGELGQRPGEPLVASAAVFWRTPG